MNCRLCDSKNVTQVLKIDNTLVDWIYSNDKKETSDFTLLKCDDCWLYQLKEIIDYDKIYSNYKFTSSAVSTISNWMIDLHKILVDDYDVKNKNILETWASDGCFLNLFKDDNNIYWVEPSKILTQNAKTNYWIDIANWYYDSNSFPDKKFDLIICRHVIEHIENIQTFIKDMINNLTADWLLYIEVPDMDYIIDNLNYTNFFHEHLNYFTRNVIEKYMSSLWFESLLYIKNKVHNWSFWIIFKKNTNNLLTNLKEKINHDKFLLDRILKNYKNIAWYWAANKTFKLLSIFDFGSKINTIFDNNKNLWWSFIISENQIEITSPQKIIDSNYDAIIIFATSYTNEIIDYIKNDLHFPWDIITIYPDIKVIK